MCVYLRGARAYLEVRAYEGAAARVVEVALHEEVEQLCAVAADGAQLGVAALQRLVAQRRAHVRAAVEERARELTHAHAHTHTHTHRTQNTESQPTTPTSHIN